MPQQSSSQVYADLGAGTKACFDSAPDIHFSAVGGRLSELEPPGGPTDPGAASLSGTITITAIAK